MLSAESFPLAANLQVFIAKYGREECLKIGGANTPPYLPKLLWKRGLGRVSAAWVWPETTFPRPGCARWPHPGGADFSNPPFGFYPIIF